MFTSRAEHRLLLREDNADIRLTEKGYGIGLVSQERYLMVREKRSRIEEAHSMLRSIRLTPARETNMTASGIGAWKASRILSPWRSCSESRGVPSTTSQRLEKRLLGVEEDIAYQVELNVKYRGYTDRQLDMVKRTKKLEDQKIPSGIEYEEVSGLSREMVEKFSRIRPFSLGQASRIPGVTPASITALLIHFKKKGML